MVVLALHFHLLSVRVAVEGRVVQEAQARLALVPVTLVVMVDLEHRITLAEALYLMLAAVEVASTTLYLGLVVQVALV
jgi:hypothetical protein